MSLWREYDAERCKQGSKDAIMLVSFDLTNNVRIQFDNVRIAGPDDDENPAVMTGTLQIFGTLHHAVFFRVHKNEDGWLQMDGDNDYEEELDTLISFAGGGNMETINLPGFSGEWLIGIHPAS